MAGNSEGSCPRDLPVTPSTTLNGHSNRLKSSHGKSSPRKSVMRAYEGRQSRGRSRREGDNELKQIFPVAGEQKAFKEHADDGKQTAPLCATHPHVKHQEFATRNAATEIPLLNPGWPLPDARTHHIATRGGPPGLHPPGGTFISIRSHDCNRLLIIISRRFPLHHDSKRRPLRPPLRHIRLPPLDYPTPSPSHSP